MSLSIDDYLFIKLRKVDSDGERQRRLRLKWLADSVATRPLGVPKRTVTEWAACGVACAVLARYTPWRIRAVTGDGDRFDYGVGAGDHECGLEVSGTTTEDLEARCRAKTRQLSENPYGVDGFVIVVGLATREVICSFHQLGESLQ